MAPAVATKKGKPARKAAVKFVLDATAPANDGIFDVAAFEKYLHDRIKVDGRTNNLSEAVAIARSGNIVSVTVSKDTTFSKRYIKYLAKKFLKKHQLRDWLRVIASDKATYTLKYFNISANDDDDE